MKHTTRSHLSDQEITAALVDGSFLSPRAAEHLKECEECRAELASAMQPFKALGDLAVELSPGLPEGVRIPAAEPDRLSLFRQWFSNSWCVRPALGIAVAVVLMLMIPGSPPVEVMNGNSPASSTVDYQTLMTDVDSLVTNAMPVDYFDLTGLGENPGDEDLMEFLVPPADEDATDTGARETEGEELC